MKEESPEVTWERFELINSRKKEMGYPLEDIDELMEKEGKSFA